MSNIMDIDELTLKCRDKYAKEYIHEAVICCKAGALRSAVVATWNSIVFDYLHKLHELSLTGDANALKRLTEFEAIRLGGEKKLKDALDFEREMLKIARDEFELLSPVEFIDLNRIQEDRNRCAHPSMQDMEEPFYPSAELVRAHMRNAVEIMLSKEPVQGNAAFKKICAEITSDYFPTKTKDACEYFQSSSLKRAKRSLIRNLLIGLAKSILNDKSQSNAIKGRQTTAIEAIIEIHKNVAEEIIKEDFPKIIQSVSDENLFWLEFFTFRISKVVDLLSSSTRTRLCGYVEKVDTSEKLYFLVLGFGTNIDFLRPSALKKLETLTNAEIEQVIRHFQSQHYISIVLDKFRKVVTYRGAEFIYENLLLPLVKFMSPEDLKTLLRIMNENNQIYGATGSGSISEQLVENLSKENFSTVKDDLNKFAELLKQHASEEVGVSLLQCLEAKTKE